MGLVGIEAMNVFAGTAFIDVEKFPGIANSTW